MELQVEELNEEKPYSERMKGMSRDIDYRIGKTLEEVMEALQDQYEAINYDAEFERVDHEAYNGFSPYTEGGFRALVLYQSTEDTSLMPPCFMDYHNRVYKLCQQDFAHDQTGEWLEDDALEVYFDKLLGGAAEDEDVNMWHEYECEYMWQSDCQPALEFKVYYYAKDNWRGEEPYKNKTDHVMVAIARNTDAPYFRESSDYLYMEHFPVDAALPDVLKDKLMAEIAKI